MAFSRTIATVLVRWTVSMLAAWLLLAGCGSGPDADEAPPNNHPGTSKTGTTSSTGSQGNAQPISTGERPSGLFESNYATNPKYKCSVPIVRGVAEPLEVERRHIRYACFPAFAHITEPIEIELTGPGADDRIVEKGTSYPDGWYWDVNVRGDMKLGTYRYRAAPKLDGSSSAGQMTGVIKVVPAREPSILKTSDTAPSGGRGLQIGLAGYPAGSHVQVFLYGPRKDVLPFARALPQAIIGSDGEAMYSWQARGDDPPGVFVLWFNPGCSWESWELTCVIGGDKGG